MDLLGKRAERAWPNTVAEPPRGRRKSQGAPPPLEMEESGAPQREFRRSPRLAQHLAANSFSCFGTKREDPRAGFEWSTPLARSPRMSPGKDWFRKFLGSESDVTVPKANEAGLDEPGTEMSIDAGYEMPFDGFCNSAAVISLEEARHHFDCALLPEANEAWVAGGGESQEPCTGVAEAPRCDSSMWDPAVGPPTMRGAGPTMPSPASLLLESLRVGGAIDSVANVSEGGVRDVSPRLSPSIFWQSPSSVGHECHLLLGKADAECCMLQTGGRPLLLATPLNAFTDQSPIGEFRRPIPALNSETPQSRSNAYCLRSRSADPGRVRTEDGATPRSGMTRTTPRNSTGSVGMVTHTRSADKASTVLVAGPAASSTSTTARLNVVTSGNGAKIGSVAERRRARPPPIAAP